MLNSVFDIVNKIVLLKNINFCVLKFCNLKSRTF